MSKAIEAEHDLGDSSYSTRTRSEKVEKPTKPAAEATTLPKCWHCPEYHRHKDCPVLAQKIAEQRVNPPENWWKAADVPKPAADQP